MHKVNMPGFTAESSIGKTRERHRLVAASDSGRAAGSVQPALPKICEVLSELVWAAYNEGAFHRGEFWLRGMERAGCFR